jgi:ribosomal protein L32
LSHGRTASREISREAHGGGLYGLNPVASLFSFMTKEEVLQNLKSSGQFKEASRSEYWRKAFELYNQATGSKLNIDHRICPKCFAAVTEWLNS